MSAVLNLPKLLSDEAYRKIDREVAKYPAEQKQSAVMAALAIAQDEKAWCSPEVIEDIAHYLAMPPVAVQEVAAIFTAQRLVVGQQRIRHKALIEQLLTD